MFDRSHYRTRSIGVRVAEADFVRLQALADAEGRPLGEWCREVLLATVERQKPTPAEQTVVSEVLALRTILLNLVFSLAKGDVLTEEKMTALIERADAEKLNKAMQRLERAVPTVPENVR
jgi:hypothetical protein